MRQDQGAPADVDETNAPEEIGPSVPQDAAPASATAPAGGDDAEASALETLVGSDSLTAQIEALVASLQGQMLSVEAAIQGAILFAALAPAALFGPQLKKLIQSQIAPRAPYGVLRRAANAFAHLATPVALYVILQLAVLALRSFNLSHGLVAAGESLLAAWIVIRMVTLVIRSPLWSRVAFYIAWPVAALDAFGYLDDVVRQLEAFSFPVGENETGEIQRFSALDLIRTLVVFAAFFWAASFANKFVKGRIAAIDELTVSFKALLSKILDVLLPIIALVAALQIVGFPFGTLAIFGGAVGLGIGLGMQRTVSNFFAGFTLIADKSIKPGDVIEVGGTFGWVTEMNARYVTIRTRDGMAHLVPNDQFINQGVTNWSHEDRVVRIHAPFGVSYGTKDLRGLARRAEETALSVDRVLKSPSPRCNLMEFGDSAINFDLRFWINDPSNGIANVRSDVFMAIWDMLAESGVEIPFPQLDLHVKSGSRQSRAAREESASEDKGGGDMSKFGEG
jgi:small-conductance mechanosensitive channel